MQASLSRRALLTLGAGAGVACLFGCESGTDQSQRDDESLRYDGPSLTLSYWNGFTGADNHAMSALVTEFNSSQADITVVSRTYAWSAFYPNLDKSAPNLKHKAPGPDVGVMQADHLATEARKRTIAPLEGVAAALNLRADDFLETAWQLGFCNGVRYGIPLDVHALAMFCNSQQLARAGIKEPPSDASTFDDACRGLQEVGFAEPCWIPNGFPALQIFLSLLWQNGGEVYNADFTEANFSSDEAVQALMWMVDQKTKGYSPALVQRDAHWQAFTGRGHTNTIEMNGIWQIPAADKAGLNYKVAPMPTIGTRKALWANSHQIFVSREAARHPHRLKACQVFIDFLSRQSSAWAAAGMIPARKTERQVAMYTESKQHALEPFLGDMRFPPPDRPGLAGITSSTLGATVMRTVSPQVSVHDARDALKQAAARANIKLKNMT